MFQIDEWLKENNRENARVLAKVVAALKECPEYAAAVKPLILAQETGDRIRIVNNFIQGGGRLSDEGHANLLNYLLSDEERWARGFDGAFFTPSEPPALFHALMNFLGSNDVAQKRLENTITGTYKFWRPSTNRPGQWVQGKLEVFLEKNTRAICAVESQKFRGEVDKSPPDDEVFIGYLVAQGPYFGMFSRMVRKDPKTGKEQKSGPPRVTIMHQRDDNEPVKMMMGSVLTCSRLSGWFWVPVYFQRMFSQEEIDAYDETLDIIESPPPYVQSALRADVEHGMIKMNDLGKEPKKPAPDQMSLFTSNN